MMPHLRIFLIKIYGYNNHFSEKSIEKEYFITTNYIGNTYLSDYYIYIGVIHIFIRKYMEKINSLVVMDRWQFCWAKKSQRYQLVCFYDKQGSEEKIDIFAPNVDNGLEQIQKIVLA